MSTHQHSIPETVLTTNTSHSKITLKPLPPTRLSTNSAETLENVSLEGDENEQTTLIKESNGVPPKAAKVGIPSSTSITDQEESNNHKKSKSLLGRSLSFLNRKEENQLVKIHKYTIYDNEREEFIEIVEEEWEGDGPPPRHSMSSQRRSTIIVDKELPSLPEPIPNKEEKRLKKFHKWVENKWLRHKRINLIILGVIVLLLFILVILAVAGVFSKSNHADNNNNSQGNINHNLKPLIHPRGF